MCLVANRAAAGARRSCLCACGCSGNSGPARSCQNPRWPGPALGTAARGGRAPLSGRASSQRGRAREQTRAELSADGVYCRAGLQRGPAASFGLGFTKGAGGHGGSGRRPLPVARRHRKVAGASRGWAGSSSGTNGTAGSEPRVPGSGSAGQPRGEGRRRLWWNCCGLRRVPGGEHSGGARGDTEGAPTAGAEVGKVWVPAGRGALRSSAVSAVWGCGDSTGDTGGGGITARGGRTQRWGRALGPAISPIPPAPGADPASPGRPQRSLPGPAHGHVPGL